MKYQALAHSCGPAALRNAAVALGVSVTEARLRALAGCTEELGTDEHGLICAAREIGLKATPHWSSDKNAAWAFVRSNVMDGRACLLCTSNWGHWVTVIGVLGDRVVLDDPSNAAANVHENGTHVLTRKQLLKRWRHRHEAEPFYAVALGR